MRSRPRLLFAFAALLLGLPVLAAESGPGASRVCDAVRDWVKRHERSADARVVEALPRFYADRGCQSAWFLGGVALAQAQDYLVALGEAEREGLQPERYGRTGLTEALGALTTGEAVGDAWLDVELRLTESFLTYAAHLALGQVSPEHFRWWTQRPEVDLAVVLGQALATGDVSGTLQRLTPDHEGYLLLKDELARHRVIAAEGGWPLVPKGSRLRRGMTDPRVAVLRQRLRVTGELRQEAPSPVEQLVAGVFETQVRPLLEGVPARTASGEPPESLRVVPDEEHFDATLEESVKAFQRAHGLEPDGEVGARTLDALRVPVEARIQQLQVNLERWRWLPEDLGARHVLVNLPAFELVAVEGREPVLRMRVIIGREDWSTPVFSEQLEHLVLNPAWHVPRRIAAEEVLPLLQTNPRAATRLGITVSRRDTGEVVAPGAVDWSGGAEGYRFHQEPGPRNPLGPVKFMFPNRFSVYLHGTPNQELFALAGRALSHGCVRVEEPLVLAAFLLKGTDGWDEATLAEAVASGTTQQVVLAEPIPVHLLYWTAFVDTEGRVNFRPDLYRRDAPLRRALGLEPRARG
jgi:murein L,D-transpeptidase YcbB/YkuD